MSKFICENPECENFGKEEEYLSNEYKMVDGHLVSNHAECPKCHCMRKEVNENANVPVSEKNLAYGEYSSASPERKRQMLQQRSHEHFEKHIKESKEEKINSAVRAFKNA